MNKNRYNDKQPQAAVSRFNGNMTIINNYAQVMEVRARVSRKKDFAQTAQPKYMHIQHAFCIHSAKFSSN
jgi:hypothetical protein